MGGEWSEIRRSEAHPTRHKYAPSSRRDGIAIPTSLDDIRFRAGRRDPEGGPDNKKRLAAGSKAMFREGQLVLSRLPHVYASDGIYTLSFLLAGDNGAPPELLLFGPSGERPTVTAVVQPDILSIAHGGEERHVAVLPDGRTTLRNGATELRDLPEAGGATLTRGTTSVTVDTEGNVVIFGPGFTLVVDRDGRISRPDGETP